MKICSRCKVEKTLIEFPVRTDRPSGYQSACYQCLSDRARVKYAISDKIAKREYNKKYRETNKRHIESGKLFAKYGITLDQYDEMLEAQGSVCAICKGAQKSGKNGAVQRFAVDHDHITGKVRGLLCTNCNTALGKFQDNVEILNIAIAYLQNGGE